MDYSGLERLPFGFAVRMDITITCWFWTGRLTRNGYGLYTTPRLSGRKTVEAHLFVYRTLIGPVPEGLELDHLCRFHACCNPEHVEPVTHRVNLLRGNGFTARKARQTACGKGHLFTGDNTYRAKNGTRHCKICHMLWQREYVTRRKLALA